MTDDYAGPDVPSFGLLWCWRVQGKDRYLDDPRWGHKYNAEKCASEPVTQQQAAEIGYPEHVPSAARANFDAGREIWDTNGDLW